MSQELHRLLHERAQLGLVKWPIGFAISAGVHLLLAVLLVMVQSGQRSRQAKDVKITWINLPAQAVPGTPGGSAPQEVGKQGERVRRVDTVAPAPPKEAIKAPPSQATPNTHGTKKTPPAKGTGSDPHSMGKAPVASKGEQAAPRPSPGAAGKGGGGGIGVGTGIRGLKATAGIEGGTGLIGDLDGDFPFLWYLQQVQATITRNWNRLGGQGRVQIYFRITQEGRIEGARVESPSGNGAMDQSALLAVRRSDPLPRLPEGFDSGALGVRFWFTYLGN